MVIAADCHRHLGAVRDSSILDPVGAVWFETALIAALQGPGGLTEVAADIAAELGLYFPDGRPEVTPTATKKVGSLGGACRVSDALTSLRVRASDNDTNVDVRTITYLGANGVRRRSHIVNMPGTRQTNLPGTGFTENVNDMGTNLRGIPGQTTTYKRGVRRAGVAGVFFFPKGGGVTTKSTAYKIRRVP